MMWCDLKPGLVYESSTSGYVWLVLEIISESHGYVRYKELTLLGEGNAGCVADTSVSGSQLEAYRVIAEGT